MATRIIPTQRQLDYMDWEFGVFFHFGIRSFFRGHKDWDGQIMPASAFQPEYLDCDQWLRTAKEAGARYAILTAKHHDGFCNWPTAYSDYSVKSSPWKDGHGDVVADYVAACRKYGLKVGLYCSPAQWGGTIDFSNEADYDTYFINQLTELLTGYGTIDYIWFDGCGSDKHHYDGARITATVRALQPNIVIFEMWDPDVRWVGNEVGCADMPNRSTVTVTDHTLHFYESGAFDTPRFLPAECDFMMRDHTWFDCEDNAGTVKSVAELMGLYELSVGRGANFLVNIGPTAQGSLPPEDTQRILAFGEALRARYGTPSPAFGPLTQGETANEWFILAESDQLIDRAILCEDLTQGEAVLSYALWADLPFGPQPRVCLLRGETIGHKAICRFPAIRTKRLTLEITTSDGPVLMRSMEAFAAE